MTRRRLLFIAVALAIVAVAVPGLAVGQLDYEWTAESGTTFEQADGPTVELGIDTDTDTAEPFPNDHTVNLSPNGEFYSDGDTSLRLEAWGDDSTDTSFSEIDASSAALTADIEGRENVTIDGSATDVSYGDVGPDTGETITIEHANGGSSDISVGGLASGERVAVIDSSGSVHEVVDADSSGEATFSTSGTETYELQTTDSIGLSLENPDPVGGQTEDVTDLSVDVATDNEDIQTDLTFTHNGQQVGTDSITGSGTVSVSTDQSVMGPNDWSVTAEDELGNSVTEEYEFAVPDELYVYNESAPTELVDNATIDVTFYGEDQAYTRTTDNGVISLEGLPNEEMTIQVEAGGYITRQTIIRSIHEQQTVFALPDNVETVTTRFELDDPTGKFNSEDTRALIKKPIERNGTTTYETVVADQFGVGELTTILEQDQRYLIEVENTETGQIRELGPYVATTSENVVLEVDQLEYTFEEPEMGYQWGAKYLNESEAIDFTFSSENAFEDLDISVTDRSSGEELFNETDLSGQDLQERIDIPESVTNPNQTSYVVEWSATVITPDGDEIELSSSVVISDKQTVSTGGIPQQVLQLVAIFAILLVAGLFSAANVGIGGVVTSLTAGIFWFVGFLPGSVSGMMIALSLLISVLWMVRNARGPT